MDFWGEGVGGGTGMVPLPEHPPGTNTVDRAYGGDFPGYAGREVEVHAAPVQWAQYEQGATSNGWWCAADPGIDPDFDIGGVTASPTSDVAYSMGVVNSSTVENFELTGRIIVPGREPERGRGPVGATEYRDNLIMQIVQAMGPDVTGEMAAVGLLSGV